MVHYLQLKHHLTTVGGTSNQSLLIEKHSLLRDIKTFRKFKDLLTQHMLGIEDSSRYDVIISGEQALTKFCLQRTWYWGPPAKCQGFTITSQLTPECTPSCLPACSISVYAKGCNSKKHLEDKNSHPMSHACYTHCPFPLENCMGMLLRVSGGRLVYAQAHMPATLGKSKADGKPPSPWGHCPQA